MVENVASLIKVPFCVTMQTPAIEDELPFFEAFGAVVDELGPHRDEFGTRRLVGIHLGDIHVFYHRAMTYTGALIERGFPPLKMGLRHFFFAVHNRDAIVSIAGEAGIQPIVIKTVDPMGAYGDAAKVATWRSPNGFILGTEEIRNGPTPTRPQPDGMVDRLIAVGVKTPNPEEESAFLRVFGAELLDSTTSDTTYKLGGMRFRCQQVLPYEAELGARGESAPFGMNHASFLVNDVEKVTNIVNSRGVVTLRSPQEADIDGRKCLAAYFISPNGVILGIEQEL